MVMIVQNNFFFNKYFQITQFVRPVCHENIFFFPLVEQKIRLLSKQFQSF